MTLSLIKRRRKYKIQGRREIGWVIGSDIDLVEIYIPPMEYKFA